MLRRQREGKANVVRRSLAAVVAAVVLVAGSATQTRADQAVLIDFVGPVAPGATQEWSFTLVVVGHGIPNVVYENAESFAAGETVTATITPIVEPEGFGSLELVGEDTLTGTTSDDWNTGEFGEFGELVFEPQLTLRFVAPQDRELGCAEHPGETFVGHVGVLAAFSGDGGTLAHIDPMIGGQGWVGAAVPIEVTCPAAQATPPAGGPPLETVPPTDTTAAVVPTRGVDPWWPLLGLSLAVFGLAVTDRRIRRSRTGRGT